MSRENFLIKSVGVKEAVYINPSHIVSMIETQHETHGKVTEVITSCGETLLLKESVDSILKKGAAYGILKATTN